MNSSHLSVASVQRQLREDWDNREYSQVLADNIKHIAEFLSNFGKCCLLRLSIATIFNGQDSERLHADETSFFCP